MVIVMSVHCFNVNLGYVNMFMLNLIFTSTLSSTLLRTLIGSFRKRFHSLLSVSRDSLPTQN